MQIIVLLYLVRELNGYNLLALRYTSMSIYDHFVQGCCGIEHTHDGSSESESAGHRNSIQHGERAISPSKYETMKQPRETILWGC